ncbi:MAG: hypothetical protein D6160_20485 [Ketobacter sp.]|nr:MAG: hypothetical protein D6160_20485 [Ketobacter sp.]
MARPAYQITRPDFLTAKRYLERKIGSASPDLGSLRRCIEPEQLQEWCDLNLTRKEWEQTKTTLRQARKRSREYREGGAPKHVDLTPWAHKVITELAKHEGFDNLSDFIEDRFRDEWADLPIEK